MVNALHVDFFGVKAGVVVDVEVLQLGINAAGNEWASREWERAFC